jgi:hypothetical protein
MTINLDLFVASPEPKNHSTYRSKSQPRTRHYHHSTEGHVACTSPLSKGKFAPLVDHIPNCPNRLIHDPLARKSDKKISSRLCRGDGDLWLEKECVHATTGKHMSFFYSAHTGRRVANEPPSGAQRVLYVGSKSKVICGGCLELYRMEKEHYLGRSVSPTKRTRI